MDDDELMELLIRGWALGCAALASNVTGQAGVLKRAREYEVYLRGENK